MKRRRFFVLFFQVGAALSLVWWLLDFEVAVFLGVVWSVARWEDSP